MSFWHQITGPLYPVLDWPFNSGVNGGYALWSGIGLVLFWPLMYWRRHKCAAKWCPRYGRHPTADGLHHLCRPHHPDLPNRRLELHEIHFMHHQAKGLGFKTVGASRSRRPRYVRVLAVVCVCALVAWLVYLCAHFGLVA